MPEDGKWEIVGMKSMSDIDESGVAFDGFKIRCPEGHTRELRAEEKSKRYLLCEDCEERYRFVEE